MYFIDIADICLNELKIGMVTKGLKIFCMSARKIIDNDDIQALAKKKLGEVTPDESSTTCH